MRYITFLIVLSIFCSCGAKHPPELSVDKTNGHRDSNDNWESYLGDFDGGAGSVLLNMSLKEVAPMPKYPYLVITGVKFTKCENGLPRPDAYAGLYEIGDSIEVVVNRSSKAIAAGTFTHECKRLNYYYLADTTGVRQRLTNLYLLSFPGYEASIHIAEDKDWEGYLKFLYPNEATIQYIQNEKLIYNLKESGDSVIMPRPIEYGIYFKTAEDRDHFIVYALREHYKIESKAAATGEYPFELTISKISPLDVDMIHPVSLELKKQAPLYNGEYDGWGCGVVK